MFFLPANKTFPQKTCLLTNAVRVSLDVALQTNIYSQVVSRTSVKNISMLPFSQKLYFFKKDILGPCLYELLPPVNSEFPVEGEK